MLHRSLDLKVYNIILPGIVKGYISPVVEQCKYHTLTEVALYEKEVALCLSKHYAVPRWRDSLPHIVIHSEYVPRSPHGLLVSLSRIPLPVFSFRTSDSARGTAEGAQRRSCPTKVSESRRDFGSVGRLCTTIRLL